MQPWNGVSIQNGSSKKERASQCRTHGCFGLTAINEQRLRILDKGSLIIPTEPNYRRGHVRVVRWYALGIFRYGLEILLIILSSII